MYKTCMLLVTKTNSEFLNLYNSQMETIIIKIHLFYLETTLMTSSGANRNCRSNVWNPHTQNLTVTSLILYLSIPLHQYISYTQYKSVSNATISISSSLHDM
jgi:hypothetical protein